MASGIILAAGFGTRLRPLTLELPKPVVPVGDRPLLAHIAAACRRGGLSRLVANAHHEREKLSRVIRELALDIEVVVEPEIRGTAGGVAGARELLGRGAVLVWNGDILTEAPVAQLLDMASVCNAQVLAVSRRPAGQGTVGVDALGRVVRLRGQSFGTEAHGGDYVGVMALGPSVVARLPNPGCLIGDVALPTLAAGGSVLSLVTDAPWTDLGDLSQYRAANFDWLDAQPASALSEGSWIGAGANVAASVGLSRCLIGANATVAGEGELHEVIVWPGASVQAPLSRAVVLSSGRVVSFGPEPAKPPEN